MKKCTCIVIYRYNNKHYEPIKIIVKHKHENISLYTTSEQYLLFDEMYSAVLVILKANNFYVHTWEMFESTWYDIDFIDIDNPEIFQYFIISDNGAEILQELTDEIVYYLPVIDCYVWGVTHWGTSWDYVLTDIPVEIEQ